ncbi:hypothetical protein BC832DRAFT_525504, partial [Gaertneriomyces semiglobifer]
IEGLSYVPQGMPTEEIERALRCMEGEEWFDPAIGRNQAMRFGKLPVWLRSFEDFGSQLLPPQLRFRQPVFDQMIANYYEPGEGLRAHVDIPHQFADGIIIFSLCGTCIMQFTRNDDEKQEPIEFFLSPGDVVCLTGPARWQWMHGIPERTEDSWMGNSISRTKRISLTLRKLLPQ